MEKKPRIIDFELKEKNGSKVVISKDVIFNENENDFVKFEIC